MSMATGIYAVVAVLAVVLYLVYGKMHAFWKCTLFTCFTGLGALGLVRLLGGLLAIPLAITPLSLLAAAVLGIPGVVFMLVMQLL